MLHTYINRHSGTPDKTKQKLCSTLLNRLIIIYNNSAIVGIIIITSQEWYLIVRYRMASGNGKRGKEDDHRFLLTKLIARAKLAGLYFNPRIIASREVDTSS